MRNQGTSTSTASDKRETNHAGSLTDTQTHTHKRRDPWRPCTRKNVRNISYTGNGCLPACLVAPRWEKGQKGKPRKMNKNNPRTSVPSHLFHIQPLLSHLTKGRWTTHFDPTETIPDRRQTSLQVSLNFKPPRTTTVYRDRTSTPSTIKVTRLTGHSNNIRREKQLSLGG